MWLVFAGVLAASIIGIIEGSDRSDPLAALGVGGIGCAGLFCCGAIIVSLIVSLIQTYAERAAVLEGMGWIDAFKRGWQVLKTNVGPTLVFWVIFLVIGLVIGGIVLAGVMAIALPIIGAVSATTNDAGAWILVPICGGGLIAIILGALIGSVINTFTSATWTLAYREMVRRTDETAAVVVQPAEQ
jgi:fucose permease